MLAVMCCLLFAVVNTAFCTKAALAVGGRTIPHALNGSRAPTAKKSKARQKYISRSRDEQVFALLSCALEHHNQTTSGQCALHDVFEQKDISVRAYRAWTGKALSLLFIVPLTVRLDSRSLNEEKKKEEEEGS